MGLLNQVFGSGDSTQGKQTDQQRFNELKSKYQSVLNEIEAQQTKLQTLEVQDNKLFIKGTVASQDAKYKIWNQVKLVDTGHETELNATSALMKPDSRAVPGDNNKEKHVSSKDYRN